MGNWITAQEAARRTGLAVSTVRNRVHEFGFPGRLQIHPGDSRRRLYVREGDLEALGQHRPRKIHEESVGRPGEPQTTRSLVAWADALTEWPAEEEMEKRTTLGYRRKDIESVLEMRIYRGKEPLRR